VNNTKVLTNYFYKVTVTKYYAMLLVTSSLLYFWSWVSLKPEVHVTSHDCSYFYRSICADHILFFVSSVQIILNTFIDLHLFGVLIFLKFAILLKCEKKW